MARPGQVVEVVSRLLAISEATVTLHNRHLREAGIREKQTKGRGHGSVSFSDAAKLLIAVLSGASTKDSGHSVNTYGGLLLRKPSSDEQKPAFLARLGQDHTFLDAVSSLLEAAASRELYRWSAQALSNDQETTEVENISIRVLASAPIPSASITLTPFDRSVTPTKIAPSIKLFYGRGLYRAPDGKRRFDPPLRPENYTSDLNQDRSFTEKTIEAVADTLRG